MFRLLTGVILSLILTLSAYAESSLDVTRLKLRVDRFQELIGQLPPGDATQARVILKGLDTLSGEIADIRVRQAIPSDVQDELKIMSDRIVDFRRQILHVQNADPQEVRIHAERQADDLRKAAWELAQLADKADRESRAAIKIEERTRGFLGKSLDQLNDNVRQNLVQIDDAILKIQAGVDVVSQAEEMTLTHTGLFDYDRDLSNKIQDTRQKLSELQALMPQRRDYHAKVLDVSAELIDIDAEVNRGPAAYSKSLDVFREEMFLSSPEAFAIEMRHAYGKLQEAERLIESGRRAEAGTLIREATVAYDRWSPTYQRAEQLYLAAKRESDRVTAMTARRTALYAWMFQALEGAHPNADALYRTESRGMQNLIRSVGPLHDEFQFLVDRYQQVAEVWAYVGGEGLKQRLQALMLEVPGQDTGKTRFVKQSTN